MRREETLKLLILAVVYFSDLRNTLRPLLHGPGAPDAVGGRT
jgi:hypothetical protein